MSDRLDLLQKYVGDMHATEKHILEAIERQAESDEAAAQPDAQDFFNRTVAVLREHTSHLDRHLETLGGSASSTVKDAVTGALGFAAGLIDQVRDQAVSKMLRDDYTALNMACVSYTMLHTTALALNDSKTAEIALLHLKHLTPLVTEINKLTPLVVVRELMDDADAVDGSAGERAVSNTQEAWDAEHVNSGPAHGAMA
jgi:ferritin-like metal-binding protein YciE